MNAIRLKNRLFITLIVIITTLTIFFAAPLYVRAVSDTRIGQATAGETGSVNGNRAGDQTGRECAISDWGYSGSGGSAYHWVYVFRAKDPVTGKKLAENMKIACANEHIGYDQDYPDRVSLYDVAKAVGWDIGAVTTNCETTCVGVVSVCLNAVGVAAPRDWSSKAVYDDLMATGLFDCYTSAAYTASAANLLPGDILCNPNAPHTAMVVESTNSFYFDLTYQDQNGESQTVSVKDGSEIVLNPNNGKSAVPITIEEPTDLSSFEPGKGTAVFKGWEKNENDTFSADYELPLLEIKTDNDRKKVKQEDSSTEGQQTSMSITVNNDMKEIK